MLIKKKKKEIKEIRGRREEQGIMCEGRQHHFD